MPSSERSEPTLLPIEPPLQTGDLPPTLGHIGPDPEDFVVDEVPAYPLSGTGEHLFLRIEKRGLTTPEVEKRLARALGIAPRDVGYAGMKDRHAITRQWFSAISKSTGEGLDLGPGVRIIEVARHDNKLRTGHLRGNRFIITLHGVQDMGAAEALGARLKTEGLANYFGGQRFGYGGRNLAQALSQLRGERSPRGRGKNAHFDLKFHASVVQAEIFNRYLMARRALPAPLLVGEVVRLSHSSRCFVVEDLTAELPRWEAGDLHPTGPIFGPKTLRPQGEPLELEEQIVSELFDGDEAALARLFREAPGTRRDLIARLSDLKISEKAPRQLVLEFELPSGSYATQLIREFVRGPFLEVQRAPRPEASDAPPQG